MALASMIWFAKIYSVQSVHTSTAFAEALQGTWLMAACNKLGNLLANLMSVSSCSFRS